MSSNGPLSDRSDPALNGLSVEAARERMLAGAERLGVETVVLAQAAGRVLAEPVLASRDQPPFDASAMDGWAIRRADLGPDAVFRVAGGALAHRAEHRLGDHVSATNGPAVHGRRVERRLVAQG